MERWQMVWLYRKVGKKGSLRNRGIYNSIATPHFQRLKSNVSLSLLHHLHCSLIFSHQTLILRTQIHMHSSNCFINETQQQQQQQLTTTTNTCPHLPIPSLFVFSKIFFSSPTKLPIFCLFAPHFTSYSPLLLFLLSHITPFLSLSFAIHFSMWKVLIRPRLERILISFNKMMKDEK